MFDSKAAISQLHLRLKLVRGVGRLKCGEGIHIIIYGRNYGCFGMNHLCMSFCSDC